MDKYPNLEIITCPKSIYDRIPKKYIEALNQLDIEVNIKYNWGNNSKFDEDIRNKVLDLFKKGLSAKNISEKLNIPLKSIYYLKYKYLNHDFKFNNVKRSKYSKELIERVQSYKKDGFSAIDVSKKENIPIRTVYYLNSIK
ncbi:MAG: hypothetical protein LBU40_05685 [Methanobrevibacter sp.]|jgi:hypothetical protein|nr:hypothetical protein [Methanobrevibacter sp.]